MIDLPKKDKNGTPMTSYSQCSMFNKDKGFNIQSCEGKYEYIQRYFLGKQFPDTMGWAAFGNKVEDAIEKQDFSKFTKEEAEVLKKVPHHPVFQKELIVPFDGFNLRMFIDNATEDLSDFVDFKTGSENSIKQYYDKSYNQLEVYALGIKKVTGKLPKTSKVIAIMREGNPFRGEPLKVGKGHRFIDRKIKLDDIKRTEEWIYETVEEISKYYKVFKQIQQVT